MDGLTSPSSEPIVKHLSFCVGTAGALGVYPENAAELKLQPTAFMSGEKSRDPLGQKVMENAASSSSTQRGRVRRAGLLALLLALLSILPFLPAVDGQWVYDDQLLIAQNEAVHSFERVGMWFSGQFFDAQISEIQLSAKSSFYRPLLLASYAFDYVVSGGSPWFFHLHNLLLHATVSCLAFFTIRRWLHNELVAFCSVLLFAVHPSKAESVAWISGRPDIYFLFFALLSLLFQRKLLDSKKGQQPLSRLLTWRCLKWTSVFCAFLSKEMAVLLPLLMMAEQWFAEGKPAFSWRSSFRLLTNNWAVWSLSALYLVLRRIFLPLNVNHAVPVAGLAHLQLLLETLGRNLAYVFYPTDLSMFAARAKFVAGKHVFEPSLVIAGAVTLAVFLSLAVVLLMRRNSSQARALLVLSALCVLCLLPTSNLVPLDLVVRAQARYLYIPLLPLMAALLLLLSRKKRLLAALTVGIGLFGISSSWARSGDFISDTQFWKEELRHNSTVPEVLRSKLITDRDMGGSALVLRRAVCAFEYSARWYGSSGYWPLIKRGVEQAAANIPDHDVRLFPLVQFFEDFRGGKRATFSHGEVTLVLEVSGSMKAVIEQQMPELMMAEAGYRLRGGDVPGGMRLIEEAMLLCPTCHDYRYERAKAELLYGKLEAVEKMLSQLSVREQEQLRSAGESLSLARQVQGFERAALMLSVGHALQDPSLAMRSIFPYLGEIEKRGAPALRMTLVSLARATGQIDAALRLFAGLNSYQKEELRKNGWLPPIPDREQPFVEGSCALPSELQ